MKNKTAKRWAMIGLAIGIASIGAGLKQSHAALASSTFHHASAKKSSKTFDFTGHNISLRSALMAVADASGNSISLPDGISGYATVSLHHVGINAALNALLTPRGYHYSITDTVITIDPSTSAHANTDANPIVIPLASISPERAIHILQSLYPLASIHSDRNANALVVLASSDEQNQMRSLLQGLDVKNPSHIEVNVITLHTISSSLARMRLQALFPQLRLTTADQDHLIVRGNAIDLAQLKTIVSDLDAPLINSPPILAVTDVFHIADGNPATIAHMLVRQYPHLGVVVDQGSLLLNGSSEDIGQAKTLITQLDFPAPTQRTTIVRRLRNIEASAAARLLQSSFKNCDIHTDTDTNAIIITAAAGEQNHITGALDALDAPQTTTGNSGTDPSGNFEVVHLRSAIPSQGSGGAAATSDSTAAIVTALQQLLPALKVVSLPLPGTLGLFGDPMTLRAAKQYIAQLDIVAPLVVLDTKVLEMDESTARNLGLSFPSPVLSTTFSEFNTGSTSTRIISLQPITRTTPLSLQAQFNFLVQNGTAHVLADPRIATLSGRTATIRAGDTIGILTTVGGGAGTYATSQLQTFQTGLSLDITPLVSPDGNITVALHPVVNSLSGILNGVPQISTRDTQTTVRLKDNQTLVIGGLIQENAQNTITKTPVLGSIPLIGGAFNNKQVNGTRNELIITVTPHLVDPASFLSSPIPEPTSVNTTNETAMVFPSSLTVPSPLASPLPNPKARQPALLQAATTPSPIPSPTVQQPVSQSSYRFGDSTASTAAGNGDPIRILALTITPSVISTSSTIDATAAVTNNAESVSLILGNTHISFMQISPGQWSLHYALSNKVALPENSRGINAQLIATRHDGATASIPIPLSSQ